MSEKVRRLDLQHNRAFTLGDKVSEQPVSLIKNTDLITNKKGNERQIHPGRCYDFLGTNEYVDVPDSDDFSFGDSSDDSPLSISAWVYMDDATRFSPISKTGNTDLEWMLGTIDNDTLRFYLFDYDDLNYLYAASLAITSYEGEWIHIAGTYDGGGEKEGVEVYLNGVNITNSQSESIGGYTAMHNTTNPVTIGRSRGTFSQEYYTDGKTFDVRVHSKELSATDVVDVMNGEPSGFEVGWWKCEEGAGDLSYDSSGNGHHGAITNATLSIFHVTDTLPYSFLNNVGYSVGHYYNDTDAYHWIDNDLCNDLSPTTGSFTVEMLTLTYDTSDAIILAHKAAGGGAIGWGLYYDSNGDCRFEIFGTTGGRQSTLGSVAGTLDDGLHHHIVVTVNADTSEVIMYIDGVLHDSRTYLSWGLLTTTGNFYMGSHLGTNWYMDGFISGFSYSDKCRTYEEVRESYFNGFINDANTIALFRPDSYGVYSDEISSRSLINVNAETVYIPRNESNIGKDVAGAPLQFIGTVKYNTELTSNCIDLLGTNEYISVPNNNDFSFTDGSDLPFSLSAWINMDDATSFYVVGRDDTSNLEWNLGSDTSDNMTLTLWDDSAVTYIKKQTYSLTLFEGEWIHVCSTYDGSESVDGMKIYINGIRSDSNASIGGTYSGMEEVTVPIDIGRRLNAYSDGKICDVRIFDTELTSAEVLNVMNCETNGNEVAWWPLAEGQGDAVYDVIGSNHGTVKNATLSTFWSTQEKFHYNLNGFSDAVYFDGTAYGSIDGADAGDFNIGTGDYTIECYIETISTSLQSMVAKYNSAIKPRWYYNMQADGTLGFYFSAVAGDAIILSTSTINDGNPHYVVFVVDRDVGAYIYIDGVLDTSEKTSEWTALTEDMDNSGDLYVGAREGASVDLYCDGCMSKVRISNKARTPDQIWNTYTNGFTVDDSTIGLWDFKEGEGIDLTTNHNDLTMTNTEHVRIPVSTDTTKDVTGQPVEHLGGRWHNGSESTIDFTGGVTSSMMSNISSGYASFNGTSDYIEIPDNDLLSFGDGYHDSPFSVGCWVKCADIFSSPFVGKYDSSPNEWLLYTHTDSSFQMILYDESNSGYLRATSSDVLKVDEWTHVLATYNGSAGIPEEIVAANNYETSGSYEITSITLRDGNVFIIWFDPYSSDYGYYTIIEPDGSTVKAATVFSSEGTSFLGMVQLDNENVYITFRTGAGSPYTAKFVIISSTGTIVTSSTTIPTISSNADEHKPVLLDNGNIFLAYVDLTSGYALKVAIFDEDGAYVSGPTTIDTDAVGINAIKMNNGNIFMTYKDATDFYYVIYSQSVVSIKAETTITVDSIGDSFVGSFRGGNVLIAFCTGSLTKYVVYDQGGAVVKAVTTVDSSGAGYYPCIAQHDNGNCVVVYQDPVTEYMNAYVVDPDGEIVYSAQEINADYGYDSYIVALHDGTHMCLYSDGNEWGAYITYDFTYAQDPSADNINIYVNGSLISTSDTSAGTYESMDNTSSTVRIGRYSTIYAAEFIRDVRIYDRELTAGEVKKEYKTGVVSDISSLVAEYKLYKDARDASINRLHGEVMSTTSFPTLTVPTDYTFGDLTLFPMYKKVMGENVGTYNGQGGWWNVKSNIAYGIWEYEHYFGSSSGVEFHFIGSSRHSGSEAYSLNIGGANCIQLRRDGTTIARTAYGTLGPSGDWRKVKIVRNSVTDEYVTGTVGTFAVYIDDVLLDVSAGAGTNPITDNTYTISNWIEVYYIDSGPGDDIRNFKINGKLVNLSPLIEDYLETMYVRGDREANYTIFERPLIAPAAIRPVHRYTKSELL